MAIVDPRCGAWIRVSAAATTLQVAIPPLADTARYDQLRADDSAQEIGHA